MENGPANGADGVYLADPAGAKQSGWPEYRVTGTVENSRDFEAGDQIAADGQRIFRHAGAEFTIDPGHAALHVQFTGWASDIVDNSRVTVTGPLVVIGDYEWDVFGHPDIRTDWMVLAIAPIVGNDDVLLDLEPAGT